LLVRRTAARSDHQNKLGYPVLGSPLTATGEPVCRPGRHRRAKHAHPLIRPPSGSAALASSGGHAQP